MRAIVSVLGKDKKGIIAKVSSTLYSLDVNIEDISQTVMQSDFFTMIMLVEMDDDKNLGEINEKMLSLGSELGVEIRVQHEDIFNSMHRI